MLDRPLKSPLIATGILAPYRSHPGAIRPAVVRDNHRPTQALKRSGNTPIWQHLFDERPHLGTAHGPVSNHLEPARVRHSLTGDLSTIILCDDIHGTGQPTGRRSLHVCPDKCLPPTHLVTYYLLFVMEVATRRVYFAGCTPNPHELWMKQIARNLTDAADGFLNGKRYILMDRDSKFCPSFRAFLKNEGIAPVRLPAESPDLNAHIERFHKSLKDEILNRMIFFGERSLRRAVHSFLRHFHSKRNHQGLGNNLIEPGTELGRREGEVVCRERLGGMLRYYYRKAA